MAEKIDFKFRIIAQKRVYLCVGYSGRIYAEGLYDDATLVVRATEVIRERDSGGDSVHVMPYVIFKGDVIIEPFVERPDLIAKALERALAQSTSDGAQLKKTWELKCAEELARRG